MMREEASLTSREVAGAMLVVVQGPEAVASSEIAAFEGACIKKNREHRLKGVIVSRSV